MLSGRDKHNNVNQFSSDWNKDSIFFFRLHMEWVNLTQMAIIYTTVGKNSLEEME